MLNSVGVALMDSLDELIQSGHLMPALALKILMQVCYYTKGRACVLPLMHLVSAQFDKSTATVFQANLKQKCNTKAHLRSYNNCDDVSSSCSSMRLQPAYQVSLRTSTGLDLCAEQRNDQA